MKLESLPVSGHLALSLPVSGDEQYMQRLQHLQQQHEAHTAVFEAHMAALINAEH